MTATPPPGAHPDSFLILTVLTSGQIRFWSRQGLSKSELLLLLRTMADGFEADTIERVE